MKTKTDNKTAYCQNSEVAYKCLAIACHDKQNCRHCPSGEFPTDSQSRGKGVNDALTGGSNASGQSSPHATPLQARNADLKGEKECRMVLRLPKEMKPRLTAVSNGIDQSGRQHCIFAQRLEYVKRLENRLLRPETYPSKQSRLK